jgi:hypothetical protein
VYHKAADDFTIALNLKPDNEAALYNRENCYKEIKRVSNELRKRRNK